MLALLAACGGSDDAVPPPTDDRVATAVTGDTGAASTAETADTGLPPGPDDCAIDPGNALRAWCTSPAPATDQLRVDVVRDDGTTVGTFRPDPALGTGILVWGLEPDRRFDWRLVDEGAGVDLAGWFHTAVLPDDLHDVALDVVSASADQRLDAFVFSPSCAPGFAVMMDADGDVIWYQDLEAGESDRMAVVPVAFTEDDTVLAIAGHTQVREVDLAGNVRLDLDQGTDFEDLVHHDIFRKDGLTYALRAREGQVGADAVIMDGVYVFDAAGAVVDEIDLEGVWPYSYQPLMEGGYWSGAFGDAIDFSHANSVFVDANGDVLVSLKHLGSLAKFQGGPGAPGFGTLLWTAVGNPDSAIVAENDFVVTGAGDATFEMQHDANLASDGTLLLLDNGDVGAPSRAVRYALDEPGRTLTLLESWELGSSCPVLGGVRELDDGHVLAVCDTTATIFEFAPGGPDPVLEARVRCGGEGGAFSVNYVPRAIPIRR
jgi:hypothetical protein